MRRKRRMTAAVLAALLVLSAEPGFAAELPGSADVFADAGQSTQEQVEEVERLLDSLISDEGSDETQPQSETAQPSPAPSGEEKADALQQLLDALTGNSSDEEEAEQAETAVQTEAPLQTEPAAQTEAPVQTEPAAQTEAPVQTEPAVQTEAPVKETEAYRLQPGFEMAVMNDTIALQVPDSWGNNASGGSVTSYSPANQSGAVNAGSGTLTTTWFPSDAAGAAEAMQNYEDEIRKLYFTDNVRSEAATAAGQQASAISYDMSVGANEFTCEVVCFYYEQTVYAVEMTQGIKSVNDYFPVLDTVVDSMKVLDGTWDPDAVAAQTEAGEPETQPAQTEAPAQTEPAAQTEVPAPQPQPVQTEGGAPQTQPAGDLGDFLFTINGQTYAFPTPVSAIIAGALPLDLSHTLSYDYSPAAADNGGIANELINTEYFYFDHTQYTELAGVTNLTGAPVPMSQGILTALIDTQGSSVSLTLPGGIQIGSAESAVTAAFPEFAGRALDGLAGFRGNELLYACNVRDDGCHGYVLIRNDAPYYSALSIICENGLVREINFECLGSARAAGIFL